jgi:hypothetical protein
MPAKIFINYRRGDDPGFAQALFGRLEQAFPPERLFMDVDNIPPGVDFVHFLDQQVAECDVLLVVIGKHWIDARDSANARRLDNPDDFVRLEIESALKQGKRVIPVLVHEARMPRPDELPEGLIPLARRNAVRLTHERFRADAQGLIKALQQTLEEVEAQRRAQAEAARLALADEQRRREEEAALERDEAQRQAEERMRQEIEQMWPAAGAKPIAEQAEAEQMPAWLGPAPSPAGVSARGRKQPLLRRLAPTRLFLTTAAVAIVLIALLVAVGLGLMSTRLGSFKAARAPETSDSAPTATTAAPGSAAPIATTVSKSPPIEPKKTTDRVEGTPGAAPPETLSDIFQGRTPSPPATETKKVRAVAIPPDPKPPARAQPTTDPKGRFVVQLTSQRSTADASAAFLSLQAKYPDVLGGYAPIIRQVDLGTKGMFYRAQVGPFDTAEHAGELCDSLKSAGGLCLVQRSD